MRKYLDFLFSVMETENQSDKIRKVSHPKLKFHNKNFCLAGPLENELLIPTEDSKEDSVEKDLDNFVNLAC